MHNKCTSCFRVSACICAHECCENFSDGYKQKHNINNFS